MHSSPSAQSLSGSQHQESNASHRSSPAPPPSAPPSPTPDPRQEAGKDEKMHIDAARITSGYKNQLRTKLNLLADTLGSRTPSAPPSTHFVQVIKRLHNNLVEFENAVPSLLALKLGERSMSSYLDQALESYAKYRDDLGFPAVTEQYWSLISGLSTDALEQSSEQPHHQPTFRSAYNLSNFARTLLPQQTTQLMPPQFHPVVSNPVVSQPVFPPPVVSQPVFPPPVVSQTIQSPENQARVVNPFRSPQGQLGVVSPLQTPVLPPPASARSLLLSPAFQSSPYSPTQVTPLQPLLTHATPHMTQAPPPHHNTFSGARNWNRKAIPFFGGDPLDFPTFLNAFETHIGGDYNLSQTEKFGHLRAYLTDGALRVVKNIEFSPNCYQQAMQKLNDTYNKPLDLLDALTHELRKARPASHDPREIKQYAQYCLDTFDDTSCCNLKSRHTIFMRCHILDRIPERYLTQMRSREAALQSYLPFHDILRSVIYDANRFLAAASEPTLRPILSAEACPSHETHVYASKVASNSQSSASNPNPCFFCSQPHHSRVCPLVPTPASKRKFLAQMRKPPCWICLSNSHRSRACPHPRCPSCGQDHAIFLCGDNSKGTGRHSSVPTPSAVSVPTTTQDPSPGTLYPEPRINTVALTSLTEKPSARRLPLAYITLGSKEGGKLSQEVALLDTGSQQSFINEDVARALKLREVGSQRLTITGIGNKESHTSCTVFEAPILLINGETRSIRCLSLSSVVGSLYVPRLSPADQDTILALHRTNSLPPTGLVTPTLLLGVDVVWELLTTQEAVTLPSGLTLLRSAAGPIVSGSTRAFADSRVKVFSAITETEKDTITSDLSLDALAIQAFEKSVTRSEEGRISVSLPFLSPPTALVSNNYSLARARLQNLYRRHHTTKFWEQYAQVIQDQLDAGILEHVQPSEYDRCPTYYIPHTAVLKPSSTTTKLRIVLDASSHLAHSPSLNDILLIGPNNLPDLRSIHVKFRLARIAILADIEKAFHQVEINNEHRDFTRLLWLIDPSKPPAPENVIHLRHTRLPFGVCSSPFLLSAALNHHLSSTGTRLAQEVKDSIYVDNLVITRDTAEEAKDDLSTIMDIFDQIGMNLREFTSNSSGSLCSVPPVNRSSATQVSALGLLWFPEDDVISIQIPKEIPDAVRTRRTAMSVLASFFDPLGLFAPILFHLRLTMNTIWPQATLYDVPVDEARGTTWANLAKGTAATIRSSQIPRAILRTPESKGTSGTGLLDVFADASALGIGICAYVNDYTTSTLLMAKSTVAPKGTIPRLELVALLAAMELVALHSAVLQMSISKIRFYSDSTTVLQWISSSSLPQPVFVVNRLKKMSILHHKLNSLFEVEYHHVDGPSNPADLASRGLSPTAFSACQNWFHTNASVPNTYSKPVNDPFSCVTHVTTVGVASTLNTSGSWDITRYSTLNSYLNMCRGVNTVLACLYKRLKHRPDLQDRLNQAFPELNSSTSPRSKAEIIAIRHHQKTKSRELNELTHRKEVVLDEFGLQCMKGRFPDDRQHPRIIAGNSTLATLVVHHYHTYNSHCGAGTTLSRIRRHYWPIPARRPLAKFLKSCVICKKHRGSSYPRPSFKELPPSRTAGDLWERVGMDEAGPFTVDGQKYHVLLITCFVTRAVHLEILHDTSSSELALALRRFFARFRTPRLIFLDNLSSHVALRKLFAHSQTNSLALPPSMCQLCDLYKVNFSFITPLSPWKGGMYERLIGVFKNCLRKMMKNHPITSLSRLSTVLAEATLLVNSRPLTPLNMEELTALTPRHFLFPYREIGLTEASRSHSECTTAGPRELHQIWAETNTRIDSLWHMWSEEYLEALRERNQYKRGQKNKTPQKGEVVLCTEMSTDRRKWHLGIIETLHLDEAGICRSVTVRHPDRKRYQRPPEALVPLEVISLERSAST